MRSFPVSIRFAFLVFLIALIVSQAGFYFYRQVGLAENKAVRETAMEAIHDGTRIASVIEYAFLAGKKDLAERMISHESADPSTTLVLLADKDDTVIYSSQYDYKGRPLAAVRPDAEALAHACRASGLYQSGPDGRRDFIRSAFPVALGVGEGGRRAEGTAILFIEKTLLPQKRAMRDEGTREFVLVTGATAVLAFLIWLPLALFIHRRMIRLTAAARELERGNYAARAALPGKDELAQLGHAFDEMAATIQASTHALAQSNAELERFAYVASHDLREPLRTIASFLTLLQRKYKEGLDAEAREYIAFAVSGAERLNQLISDILQYSRIATKGKDLLPTESRAALEVALDHLQAVIRESGAHIERKELPLVLADGGQLALLFQNLIGNAIKFRGQMPPRIEVGGACREGECTFTVRDNGIGIAPKYHQRLFQMFMRLHTQAEYPGTGIGLAICKKIVDRHGGRIWLESEAGHGATFHFTLPAAEPPTE